MKILISRSDGVRLAETPLSLEAERVITFGRSSECTVVIGNCLSLSRVQATLERRGADWYLIDGGASGASSTGIWVEGVRVVGEAKIEPEMDVRLFSYEGVIVHLVLEPEVSKRSALEDTLVPELTYRAGSASPFASAHTRATLVQPRAEFSDGPDDRSPRSFSEGTKGIGAEVADLRVLVEGVRAAIQDHERHCRETNDKALTEIRELVKAQGEKIDTLTSDVGRRIELVNQRDAHQDARHAQHEAGLKRVIATLAGLLGVVAVVTGGRDDAGDILNKMLTIASVLGASGGGAALIHRGHADRDTGQP